MWLGAGVNLAGSLHAAKLAGFRYACITCGAGVDEGGWGDHLDSCPAVEPRPSARAAAERALLYHLLDEAVERWHESGSYVSLAAWLGITEECATFVENPAKLARVFARRST